MKIFTKLRILVCTGICINFISFAQNNPPIITSSSQYICSGESVTLWASGCLGDVTWSNGMMGTSITTNTSGIFTANCTVNSVKSIESNQINIVSNNSGFISLMGNSICSNSDIELRINNLPVNTYPSYFLNGSELIGINTQLYRPIDGGEYTFIAKPNLVGSWVNQDSKTTQNINDIFFINADRGWYVGSAGRVGYTTNSGLIWNSQILSSTIDFLTLHFIDESIGWIGGTNGRLMKTVNGGLSWFNLSISNLTDNINGIFFVNSQNGWLVTSRGRFYKTTNGGGSWILQPWITSSQYTDVFFFNNDIGWIIGNSSFILKTIDGGNTWDSFYFNMGETKRNSIFFSDSLNGWITGDRGSIAFTKDGGVTWKKSLTNTEIDFKKVAFTTLLNGWAVGENGSLFYTDNGGKVWIKQDLGINNNINTISIQSKSNICIGGYAGTIKKHIQSDIRYCPSNKISIKSLPKPPEITVSNCNSTSTTLVASQCQGSIIWSTGFTGNQIVVYVDGTYSARCVYDGCSSNESTVKEIKISNIPILQVSNGNTCLSESVNLIGSSENGDYLEWRKNNKVFFNDGNTFSPTEIGNYDVVTCYKGEKKWKWESPKSPTSRLYCTVLTNKNTGWIGGEKGLLMNTVDGGLTWKYKYFEQKFDFLDIQFVNEQVGFAVAFVESNNYIIKTVDGGKNWQVINMGYPNHIIYNIHFLNSDIGWAVGSSRTILKTTDGGSTWSVVRRDIYGSNTQYRSVFFLNSQKGWVVGENDKILFTIDGGVNWDEKNTNTNTYTSLIDIHFINENKGIAVGTSGLLITTNDGGNSWQVNQKMITDFRNRNDKCQFISETVGWVFSNEAIYKTIDGGNTWGLQEVATNGGFVINGYFIDELHGLSVGNNGKIVFTHDGGLNWSQNSNSEDYLSRITYSDKYHGWVMSAKKIGMTSDGGRNWSFKALDLPRTGQLNDLFFLNSKKGWVIGERNSIFITIDGGETWEKRVINPNFAFTALHFVNENKGFVVGLSGVIMTTVDGGRTWESILNFRTNTYKDIMFVNELNGWIVGTDGAILFTIDGGRTWNPQYANTTNELTHLYFIDENNGWIAAGNELLRTTNGGVSWAKSIFQTNYFQNIHFISPSKGWAIVSNGEVAKSNDGGISWQIIGGIANGFTHIYVSQEEEFTVVGPSNGILKYGFDIKQSCPSNLIMITEPPAKPKLSSFSNVICSNQNLKIYATECSGDILWYNGYTGNELSITDSGTYSAKCVVNGCSSDSSETVVITKNPNCPNLELPSNLYICPNRTVTLSLLGCPSNNVKWSNGLSGSEIQISVMSSTNIDAFCSNGGRKTVNINVGVENLNLTDSIIGKNHTFEVNNLIKSSSKIRYIDGGPSTSVSYYSGKSILLQSGFEVTPNNLFKAEIKGCSN